MQVAQGDLPAALASYQACLAISERLAKADPNNAGWQRDLSVSHDKIGDVLEAQGNLKAALETYRNSLTISKALVAKDGSNKQWQGVLDYGIGQIGSLAYRFVIARDFADALEAADEAIALAPDKIWIYTNRAHALMFLGWIDEARALYLQYRGKPNVVGDKPWEGAILADFAELRKAGLTHPLMDEIENTFKRGVTVELVAQPAQAAQ